MKQGGSLEELQCFTVNAMFLGPIRKIQTAQEVYVPELIFYFIILVIAIVHLKKIALVNSLLG